MSETHAPLVAVKISVTNLETGETTELSLHKVENWSLSAEPEFDDRDFEKWLARGGQGLAPLTVVRAIQLQATGRAVRRSDEDPEILHVEGAKL